MLDGALKLTQAEETPCRSPARQVTGPCSARSVLGQIGPKPGTTISAISPGTAHITKSYQVIPRQCLMYSNFIRISKCFLLGASVEMGCASSPICQDAEFCHRDNLLADPWDCPTGPVIETQDGHLLAFSLNALE